MKKIICFLVYYIFISGAVFSQCGDLLTVERTSLLSKYWQLREQFNEHFIKIDMDEDGNLLGDGIGSWDADENHYSKAGYSLPAAHLAVGFRGDHGENVVSSTGEILNTQGEAGTNNVLNYGGDVTYTLGMYIAMLSTEYELLRRNGLDSEKDKTLKELFLALQSIKRLDMTANRLANNYCCNCGDSGGCIGEPDYSGLSGFLLRDDVPASFHNMIDSDTYSSDWRVGGVSSQYADRLDEMESVCDFRSDTQLKTIAGQDQIISLLFGLAFVKKYIPLEEFVSENDVDHYPLSIAQSIATSMVERIRVNINRQVSHPACPGENPWGEYIGNGNGGNASATIHGMIRVLDFIDPSNDINSTLFWDIISWQSYITAITNGQVTGNDNVRMAIELMTAGDTNYGDNAKSTASRDGYLNLMQHFAWAALHDKNVGTSTISLDPEDDKDPVYGEIDNKLVMRRILSSLGCEGPCNQVYGTDSNGNPTDPLWNGPPFDCSNNAINRWCSGERWKHSLDRLTNCELNPGSHTPYGNKSSGYDYMLAYNLYHLVAIPQADYFNPFTLNSTQEEMAIDHICGDEFICLGDTDGSIYSLVEGGEPSELNFDNIVWTSSPNLLLNVDDQEDVIAFVNTQTPQRGWIAVEFNDGTCKYAWRKEINIGPEVPEIIRTINTSNPCIFAVNLGLDPIPGFEYEWSIDFQGEFGSIYSTSYYNSAYAEVTNSNGGVILYSVTITSECGIQIINGSLYVPIMQQCDGFQGPGISLSPNPANDHINVELTNAPIDVFASGGHIEYFLIDQYSNVKKTVTSTNFIETINTSDLPNGLYHILGQLGDETINSSTIVIQH